MVDLTIFELGVEGFVRTMAAEKTSSKYIRECSICLEDMSKKKPKLLECKHSYCMECLTELYRQHGTSSKCIICPQCKHETDVRSGNVSHLPDNFLLLEFKKAFDDHIRVNYCFYCYKQDRETRAVSHCNTCWRYMCKDCTKKHKKNFMFAGHELIFSTEENRTSSLVYCSDHNEKIVHACLACSPVRKFCDVCLTLEEVCHPDDVMEYHEYAEALSVEESKLRTTLDYHKNVNDLVSTINKSKDEAISRVQERVAMLKQNLEEWKTEMTNQIQGAVNMETLTRAAKSANDARARSEELLENDKRDLKDVRLASKQLKEALSRFNKEKRNVKVVRVNPDFKEHAHQEFLNFRQRLIEHFVSKPELVLCTRSEDPVSKLRASRNGHVMFFCEGDHVITDIDPSGEIQYLQTPQISRSEYGIAFDIYENHVYFTCHERTGVTLYKCELPLDDTSSLSTCSDITPLHNTPWLFQTELCVLDNGNVIFVLKHGDLYKYDINSGKIENKGIPYQGIDIKLTRINHEDEPGFISTYLTENEVALHDAAGIVKQIISSGGSPVNQPTATSVNDRGNLLVADCETASVVELTVDGHFVQNVLSKEDGLQNPVNVVYSHPYLWVVDQATDGEHIFKCFRV